MNALFRTIAAGLVIVTVGTGCSTEHLKDSWDVVVAGENPDPYARLGMPFFFMSGLFQRHVRCRALTLLEYPNGVPQSGSVAAGESVCFRHTGVGPAAETYTLTVSVPDADLFVGQLNAMPNDCPPCYCSKNMTSNLTLNCSTRTTYGWDAASLNSGTLTESLALSTAAASTRIVAVYGVKAGTFELKIE